MWCSRMSNKITIYEPETKEIYATFDGVKLLGRKEDGKSGSFSLNDIYV